ncbi:MAG TPA: hypothetical protein VLG92_04910 [Candidatus Saccharimonadia bacterium]|nr:hypothetical protein [Candidatus Saccharimonadia bacterium]
MDSHPEDSLDLIDPPFEKRAPGDFVLLDTVPLGLDFAPTDLSPLRARVEQIASLVVQGTVDPGMITGLNEAVTNAADIASQALKGVDYTPRRHAVAVAIGHTAHEIIFGVTDDSPKWVRSPERPGTIDPDEDLGNFINFSLSQAESSKNLASTDITGRGTTVIRGTAKRVSYTATDKEKTVWASYPHPIVREAARLARASHRRHSKNTISRALYAAGSSLTHKLLGVLDISREKRYN